jgi:hypothetical protein
LTEQGREAWREAMRAEEQRRRPRPADQRTTLRRVTVGVAVAAAGLNVVLFLQTGIRQLGPGDFQNAVVSAIAGLCPGTGLRPAAQAPSPAPHATPVATTGGS